MIFPRRKAIYFDWCRLPRCGSWRWIVAETIGNYQSHCGSNYEKENASGTDQARGAEHEDCALLTADPLLDQHVAPNHDESEN